MIFCSVVVIAFSGGAKFYEVQRGWTTLSASAALGMLSELGDLQPANFTIYIRSAEL